MLEDMEFSHAGGPNRLYWEVCRKHRKVRLEIPAATAPKGAVTVFVPEIGKNSGTSVGISPRFHTPRSMGSIPIPATNLNHTVG